MSFVLIYKLTERTLLIENQPQNFIYQMSCKKVMITFGKNSLESYGLVGLSEQFSSSLFFPSSRDSSKFESALIAATFSYTKFLFH